MQIDELRKELEQSHEVLLQKASVVSALRTKSASSFSHGLEEMVAPLGIPNVRFRAEVKRLDDVTAEGMDRIEFLFAANKNADLQPVSQTASGG